MLMITPPTSPNDHIVPSPTSPNDHIVPPPTSPNDHIVPPPTTPNDYIAPPPTSPNDYIAPSPTTENVEIIQMKVFGSTSPILIDISMIKTSKFLEGAKVLKYLFCVLENSEFLQTFSTDENGTYNLFENYHIDLLDWLSLQRFIRTGLLPTKSEEIERLQFTCEKLGGVPFLDNLITALLKNIEEPLILCPKDDIERKYIWGIHDKTGPLPYTTALNIYKPEEGWSIVSLDESTIWFRKERINL